MKSSRICGRCGNKVAETSPDGLCTCCMVRDAFETSEEALPTVQTGLASGDGFATNTGAARVSSFGDFELLEEIARGGMGVVYRGRQKSLDRLVAIKIILVQEQADTDAAKRFESEAQAAARLQHPNIVGVHEVGRVGNQNYLSMDYVEGANLHELCAKEPLDPERAARYVKTIAEAIHYAHGQGVLHRDLKPSNVLIDRLDQPHVTDFGLAKLLGTDAHLTLTGQALGTPQYIPPEQASIHHGQVGPWSDVYSMGGILYHLVTGRPPFVGGQVGDVLEQVLQSDPVAPRILNPSVPRDLETICLKCLEKDPHRRYATAGELAEELGRYLDNQPILARPASYAERTWRWCRHRPLIAGLWLALTVALVAGLGGVLWQWQRAAAGELVARQNAYAGDMILVQQALAEGDFGQARQLLDQQRPLDGQTDLRGWEWRYRWQQSQPDPALRRSLYQHTVEVPHLAVSADGKWLALGGADGTVAVVDLLTGQSRILQQSSGTSAVVAFAPKGDVLAYSDSAGSHATAYVVKEKGTIKLWDAAAARELCTIEHTARILELAFSPDGRFLAASTTDETWKTEERIKVWDLQGGHEKAPGETPLITDLQVSTEWNKPEGSGIPYMSGGIQLYSAFDGPLAISPQGDLLAFGDVTGQVHLVELPDCESRRIFPAHDGSITALAFSPDGAMLATGSGYPDSSVRLWNARTGQAIGQPLVGHQRYVHDVTFSPDGKLLASASADQSIRLWEAPSGREITVLRGHRSEIMSLVFVSDGAGLVSACKDGSVWQWDVVDRTPPSGPPPVIDGIWQFVFMPDGKTAAVITTEGRVQLWNLRQFKRGENIAELGSDNWMIAPSPDGRLLAVGTSRGQLKLWDLGQRRVLRELPVGAEYMSVWAKFTSGGQQLFSGGIGEAGRGIMWDTATWKPTASWQYSSMPDTGDVSASGRFFVGGFVDASIRAYEFATQRERRLPGATGVVTAVAISPDESKLVTGNDQGLLTCWDTLTWQPLGPTLQGQRPGIYSAVFSPDGRRIASAGGSGEEAVKLWDVEMRRPVATLAGEGSRFIWVSFSPDGNTVAAVARDSEKLHLWRAPSWADIAAAEKERSNR